VWLWLVCLVALPKAKRVGPGKEGQVSLRGGNLFLFVYIKFTITQKKRRNISSDQHTFPATLLQALFMFADDIKETTLAMIYPIHFDKTSAE
jgi:hypothetical protein